MDLDKQIKSLGMFSLKWLLQKLWNIFSILTLLLNFCALTLKYLNYYYFNLFSIEKEILDRNEEKNELAKALSRSYEELQKARTASAQVNSQ